MLYVSRDRSERSLLFWAIVGTFFTIVIASCLHLIWISREYDSGRWIPKGQIEAAYEPMTNWDVKLVIPPGGTGLLNLSIPQAPEPAKAYIVFQRPAEAGWDQTLPLQSLGKGQFTGELRLPKSGHWQARIHLISRDRHWEKRERVMVSR